MKKAIRKYSGPAFQFLLVIAALISLVQSFWITIFLIAVTCVLLLLPYITHEEIKENPSKVELLILLLIYVTIFVQLVVSVSNTDALTRSAFYLMISIIIALIGFSLIYLLNQEKQSIFKLSPLFIAIFAFCFSLTIGALWQIFRFGIEYLFGINIQNYNPSDALGFLAVHSIGAAITSFLGYILISDKYFSKQLRFIVKKLGLYNTSEENILQIIKQGESVTVEFKSTLRTNLHTKQIDKRMEHACLKTLSAFLNTKGGTLLIGVNDEGQIEGTDQDKFKSQDKMGLHLTNLLKQHLGAEASTYITYDTAKVKEKTVLKVEAKASSKPVFLKYNGEELFYVRTGPSSIELKGKKLVSYTKRRFKK